MEAEKGPEAQMGPEPERAARLSVPQTEPEAQTGPKPELGPRQGVEEDVEGTVAEMVTDDAV